MIVQQDLLRAIKLMQAGDAREATLLLQKLLEDPALDDNARATVYVWLAESRDDLDFKINCLQQALLSEPDNLQIRQVLDQLLAAEKAPQSQLGKSPSPARVYSLRLAQAPPVVAVKGGPNGPGSGMFVNRQGLVATTSYVSGAADRLVIAIDSVREISGQVLRRYPPGDVALIDTSVVLDSLGSVAPGALLAQDETIYALGYAGTSIRGNYLGSVNSRRHWLVTSFPQAMLPDSGGNPVQDAKGNIIGLLTRNADHDSGSLYAISIAQVMRLAEQTLQERRLLPDAGCCGCCGSLTRAGQYGGRYCETCGAFLRDVDEAVNRSANATQLAQLYDDNESRPCPNCAAAVGFYAGRCLRCAFALANQPSAD